MATSVSAEQIELLKQLFGDVIEEKRDKKLEPYLKRMDARFHAVEKDVSSINQENRKLKARVCALESLAFKKQVELVGFPSEPNHNLKNVVMQLAKLIGLSILKLNHLISTFSYRTNEDLERREMPGHHHRIRQTG